MSTLNLSDLLARGGWGGGGAYVALQLIEINAKPKTSFVILEEGGLDHALSYFALLLAKVNTEP